MFSRFNIWQQMVLNSLFSIVKLQTSNLFFFTHQADTLLYYLIGCENC